MIIETSANQFYTVAETGKTGLEHCWYGYSVKMVRGEYVMTAAGKRAQANSRPELVRKAATRIVVEGFNPEDHYARTNAPHNPEAIDLIGHGAVNHAEQNADIRDEEIGG